MRLVEFTAVVHALCKAEKLPVTEANVSNFSIFAVKCMLLLFFFKEHILYIMLLWLLHLIVKSMGTISKLCGLINVSFSFN